MSQQGIYLSFEQLKSYGVPKGTIKAGVSRNRAGEVHTWVNIPNPNRKAGEGKVLIQYDSIPATTRDKMPTRGEILQAAADAANGAKRDEMERIIRGLLPAVPPHDLATLKSFRITRDSVDLLTGEAQQQPLSGLPEATLKNAALACRWLALLSDKRWKNKADRVRVSPAFERLKDMQDAIVAVFSADDVDLPTSPSKLAARLRDYAEQGALAVVPAYFGNQNTRKVKDEQLEYLISLFGKPTKPSFELVHGWYGEAVARRQAAGLEAWPEITVGTVKNNLMDEEVQPVWYLGRHGYEAWKNKYEYTALRYRPSFRDALWVVDGTKVNYYYRKPGGRKGDYWAKLQVVAVIDAATDRWLGWAFGEQENAALVAQAMRMAVQTSGGVLPWQVQYDNDSANKAFFGSWAGLHFPAMPRNGQSKIIEQAFGKMQQQVMRRNVFFTGQNITAKSQQGKATPELLAGLLKSGELPTLAEVLEQAALDFHIWNELPARRDGQCPRQRYEASEHPAPPARWSDENTLETFGVWNERPIEYRRNGLVMQQGRERLSFEVLDAAGQPDLAFHARNVGVKFWVKYDAQQQPLSKVGLYVEVGDDRRFVAWAETKQALPMAVADYQPGDRARVNQVLAAKKTQRAETAGRLADISERLDSEELAKLGHTYIPKGVLNAAEAAYRAGEELAPVAAPVEPPAPLPLRTAPATRQAVQDHYLNLAFEDE